VSVRTESLGIGSRVQRLGHARDPLGALLQFVDADLDWHTPTTDYRFDDVPVGRLHRVDAIACPRS